MFDKYLLYTFISFLVLTSCTKEDNNINTQQKMDKLKNTQQNKWDQLAKEKIYFGHQSVGYNMMDGIENILKQNPNIKLNIVEGDSVVLFNNPVLAHSRNGKNGDPKSKIDAFCKEMEGGLGNKVDMAGFKFCYIDFDKDTNVKELFNYYKTKINKISLVFPNVTIMHYTVPLTSIQSGAKAIIKKVLGKDTGIKSNLARQQFNDLLLNEFKDQHIFDLAKFESTYPDGKREYIEVNNKKVFSMVPAYTDDGGHLSEKGKYQIGIQYLLFLAKEANDIEKMKKKF